VADEPEVVVGLEVVAGEDLAVAGAVEVPEEARIGVLDRRPGGGDGRREVQRAG
jgi:hypothetical protein